MDEKVLHAAFIPFGDIIDVQIPLDYATRILSIIDIKNGVCHMEQCKLRTENPLQ